MLFLSVVSSLALCMMWYSHFRMLLHHPEMIGTWKDWQSRITATVLTIIQVVMLVELVATLSAR